VTRTFTRRAALAVLGTSVAALTGATARRSTCTTLAGEEPVACADGVALSGPTEVAAAGSGPQFVAANEGDEPVAVGVRSWAVLRRERGDWMRTAAGPGGERVRLATGERAAWVVLSDDDAGAVSTATARTQYVGPVAFSPGEYAFVVAGRCGGERFEATHEFAVTG
jgi:hypothetical protein